MHNGQIGGYAQLRRTLESLLPDPMYAARRGATDSELLFLLCLARIEGGAAPADAMRDVLDHTQTLMRGRGIEQPLRFAAVLSDGHRLHAFRLSSDDQPPTLYRRDDAQGTEIASEPLDDDHAAWTALAAGAVLSI